MHRCNHGSYEFIELKLESDNPVYAAMEVLQYGVLYILARDQSKAANAPEERKLLKAKTIQLKVLAPENYYKGFELAWLERKLCRGLEEFLAESNFQMSFSFEAFPPGFGTSTFRADSNSALELIKAAVANRRFVY